MRWSEGHHIGGGSRRGAGLAIGLVMALAAVGVAGVVGIYLLIQGVLQSLGDLTLNF